MADKIQDTLSNEEPETPACLDIPSFPTEDIQFIESRAPLIVGGSMWDTHGFLEYVLDRRKSPGDITKKLGYGFLVSHLLVTKNILMKPGIRPGQKACHMKQKPSGYDKQKALELNIPLEVVKSKRKSRTPKGSEDDQPKPKRQKKEKRSSRIKSKEEGHFRSPVRPKLGASSSPNVDKTPREASSQVEEHTRDALFRGEGQTKESSPAKPSDQQAPNLGQKKTKELAAKLDEISSLPQEPTNAEQATTNLTQEPVLVDETANEPIDTDEEDEDRDDDVEDVDDENGDNDDDNNDDDNNDDDNDSNNGANLMYDSPSPLLVGPAYDTVPERSPAQKSPSESDGTREASHQDEDVSTTQPEDLSRALVPHVRPMNETPIKREEAVVHEDKLEASPILLSSSSGGKKDAHFKETKLKPHKQILKKTPSSPQRSSYHMCDDAKKGEKRHHEDDRDDDHPRENTRERSPSPRKDERRSTNPLSRSRGHHPSQSRHYSKRGHSQSRSQSLKPRQSYGSESKFVFAGLSKREKASRRQKFMRDRKITMDGVSDFVEYKPYEEGSGKRFEGCNVPTWLKTRDNHTRQDHISTQNERIKSQNRELWEKHEEEARIRA
ncbi:PREDICTED: uncharacterized protein DDB_G0287625-like [Ipomoea nil]|uniref:uncharacterized protein DDB_G0287625-like n=1 Tax=Ipomoea nil TaxID=35883 RepID=UPI0009012B83|nr:PREDICTED: uncharacterized protein DDB_G0287625-like [Ipomoea nil]